jgi:hypothetical protein
VISVHAKHLGDLYNKIVRKYAGTLDALRPVIEIPVKNVRGARHRSVAEPQFGPPAAHKCEPVSVDMRTGLCPWG